MLEHLGSFKRTCYCGEVSKEHIGKQVNLCGWVCSIRDHGGVIFIDLRDRTGKVQIIFSPETDAVLAEKAKKLKDEYVVAISGTVRKRPEGTENPKIKTGDIEIVANYMKILNKTSTLPFQVEGDIGISEELRLKYRYLDIRRERMTRNLIFKHRLYQITREVFVNKGFIEVETPILTKSTPEGARDFLVPSRLHPGKFYALPQSPQLFKQILMIAGIDRYFQIAKCLRDEDLRADRQPEFTQIDFEMSFVEERDVMEVAEHLLKQAFRNLLDIDLNVPFPEMTYDEAMQKYGTDRPDTRFSMELVEITDIASKTNFNVFKNAVEKNGIVKSIKLQEGAKLSRKEIDQLTKFVQIYGAKGLAWIKILPNELQSPIVKFLPDRILEEIIRRNNAKVGDIIFFVADREEIVNHAMSNLRIKLAKLHNLIDESKFNFVWITNFPMFEWNDDEKRWEALHHPFTSPKDEDTEMLEENPQAVRSKAYDIVLNGVEIGGGSIRIHRADIQEKIFRIIGLDDTEANKRFGFLIEALKYGAPPHGGMAFGLDRLCAIMLGEDTIREVIPFPKTQRGQCLLTGAPDTPDENLLNELSIEVNLEE